MYFGTLLHEMLHAFLKMWGCRHSSHYYRHKTEGIAGHGHVWQNVAYAPEIAVRDERFLDLKKVELSRELSWAEELKIAGRGWMVRLLH